ncbi:MAG: methylaspartate mutase subunit E [Alphaproteobacteria bacterium]|jgi:methylaspartate mutase epsilon subunit|nr:methylaspartate mutase subunit E [Alphaproteobacteria bacterium]
MHVSDKKWSEDELMTELDRIKALHPTGQAIDLDEILAYHRQIPASRRVPEAHKRAAEAGEALLQPRSGMATVEEMIETLRHLETHGADLLTWTCDTYCRRNLFEKAAEAVAESQRVGRSLLNGFPAVVHGVAGCRQLFEALEAPCEGRGASGTPQAYNTFMLAGGATSFNGASLFCALSVEPHMPVAEVIGNFQYVDRLLGWFEERGASVSREAGGFPSGTITPPCVSIVASIIECLLAAEQGLKSLCVAYPLNSCLNQDIAAVRMQHRLCADYLERAGFADVHLTQAAHQWLGAYSDDLDQTFARICVDTVTCAFAGVSKILVKSPEEGRGAPTKEGNASGIVATRKVLDLMRGQSFPESEALTEEMEVIEQQCRAMMDRVLELGDGDVAQGTAIAFERGVLDFPFSVNRHNADKAMIARDVEGAVRFIDSGNLPFTPRLRAYDRDRMEERRRREAKDDMELMIDDLRAVVR